MGKPCVNVAYHGSVWASMGEQSESGFPHKTNSGTNGGHRWNQVYTDYGIAWEARKILHENRALHQCVAMRHRSTLKR